MSIGTSTGSRWSRKMGPLLLLIPLAVVVIAKDPHAVASGLQNLVVLGAQLLNWCAEAISRLIAAFAAM